MTTLSVIVITKNEARHIGECLDSVSFADEIIVVDSGSTDATREIALAKGAKVHVTHDWPGFGPQKNRALDLATQEWVLSIDADERVTPELAGAIGRVLADPSAQAYKIARLSNFCGRWIRHSGWWPDHVLRLFKRGSARFTDAAVHESVQASGAVAVLDGHFLHYPYADLESMIAKVNRYSTDAAAMMHARGKTTSMPGVLGHAFWTLVRIYVIRRGFLDGKEGVILAVTAAAGSFFRYSKLWILNRNKSE
ncbi:MAG TPA: glycosyltransferase family 2 protein [Eoetvoesiella sp.]|jgi:glycosyltransferase involved in cell wall biosynthesis|uniref:glycosyltransferase family 2 protein n=1 Tax=Eoetvoesiella sp. TaxID=1966355 RepID=UPI002CB7FEC9|nr:glycosyltransferase family 2 protein [Eoetvoesiella sp.]HWK63064.1 glycosyltransferase family 2 protein [Eoetvoesiella sp.]